jgi:leucyl-tRNA synthetase
VAVPRADRSRELFTHPELRSWLPVHAEVWGADGGFYLANERALTKMLRDAGVFDYLKEGEPYVRAVMHEMVRVEGRKMSKHLGNVVDPDELVARVGADTVRLTILYAAAPRNGIEWNEQALDYCHRIVLRLWNYARPRLRDVELSRESSIDTSDRLRRQLAKGCDTATRKVTSDLDTFQMHKATRNVIMLLSRIEEYERAAIAARGSLEDLDREAIGVALLLLVKLSAPLVPHLAEELWAAAGREPFVCTEPWPERVPSRAARRAAPSRAGEAARKRGPLAASS